MKVLVTGGFGIVGTQVVRELIGKSEAVRIFERPTRANKRSAAMLLRSVRKTGRAELVEVQFGNLLNIADVTEAVQDIDAVIHTAAVIPPLADSRPKLAEYVNVAGTGNLVRIMEQQIRPPRLIFTSSVAVYGDRVADPCIRTDDPPAPNGRDIYARQKLRCEEIIRNSSLDYTIPRLTYIVSPEKLKMDPIMFDMPLDTSLELCSAEDTGTALVQALYTDAFRGRIWHLAGGKSCRISYGEYLERMMKAFGLGRGFLPREAFSTRGFHCGYMDTGESGRLLEYQNHTREDYFRGVVKKYRVKRFFIRLVRPAARWYILSRSPYYRRFVTSFGRTRSRMILGTLFYRNFYRKHPAGA